MQPSESNSSCNLLPLNEAPGVRTVKQEIIRYGRIEPLKCEV